MISQQEAEVLLAHAADEFIGMSYDELKQLEKRIASGGADSRELLIHGEKLVIFISIGEYGVFRKRVAVELTLAAAWPAQWPRTPCAYFERFRSGRLYVATHAPIDTPVILALQVLGGVSILLVAGYAIALIWRAV